MRYLWMSLICVALAFGCDDESGGDDPMIDMGQGGAGGEGGAGGGGPTLETFTFTSLTMTEPAGAAGLLNPVLTSNLNNGSLVVLVQIEDWASEMPILRGGAGQLIEGADTADDVSDDVFTWLTEGTCEDADGMETACSVDINEKAASRSGDDFTLVDGDINIYAQDLKLIIPIKALGLTGTRNDIDMSAQLTGVITQADAQNTRFRLTPEGNLQTLESLLTLASVMPDTMFNGAPAYTFAGSFESELITWEPQE